LKTGLCYDENQTIKGAAMISYVKGPLVEVSGDRIVIETGNVGLEIRVPLSLLDELPKTGEQIKVYTYFQVREDAMSLYGFLHRQDREMFQQLLGVNGVGPKGALGILSALRPDDLRMAIISGDAKAISRAPGIGTKTAQRVILDLKDKVSPEDLFSSLEEEGLDVTVSVGNGADKSMTALLSDSADIALLGTEAGLYVYNEGKEAYPKAFAQLTQKAGNFLVSRTPSPDFQWTDLEGSDVIGGRLGGMPELVLEYVLRQNGMEPFTDVEIVNNIDFTSTAGAFTGGIGDYTVEFEPTATALQNSGAGYIVASLGAACGEIPYTVYMANDAYMQENPEVIEAFTRAIYRGQQWVDTHTAAEIAEVILPQFPDSDLETLTSILERYQAQDTWKTDPTFSKESYERLQDIMEQGGELESRVPFENFVDNSIAEEVTAAGLS